MLRSERGEKRKAVDEITHSTAVVDPPGEVTRSVRARSTVLDPMRTVAGKLPLVNTTEPGRSIDADSCTLVGIRARRRRRYELLISRRTRSEHQSRDRDGGE